MHFKLLYFFIRKEFMFIRKREIFINLYEGVKVVSLEIISHCQNHASDVAKCYTTGLLWYNLRYNIIL